MSTVVKTCINEIKTCTVANNSDFQQPKFTSSSVVVLSYGHLRARHHISRQLPHSCTSCAMCNFENMTLKSKYLGKPCAEPHSLAGKELSRFPFWNCGAFVTVRRYTIPIRLITKKRALAILLWQRQPNAAHERRKPAYGAEIHGGITTTPDASARFQQHVYSRKGRH